MEEARDSTKSHSEDFSTRKQLLYDFFQRNYKLSSEDCVDESNLPFLRNLPNDSLLYHVFRKSKESVEGDLTLDIFLEDLTNNVKILHDQIAEKVSSINRMQESSRVMEALVKKNEDKKNGSKEEPPQIFVSYVKDKKYESEIFNICRLKYKLSTNLDPEQFKSIYSEKKKRVCSFEIAKDLDTILVHILAKKNESYQDDKEFSVIATASLPILELYSSIKPIYFDLDEIPPIFQVINYEYDPNEGELGEGVKEINCTFELKFEVRVSQKDKTDIMKNLLKSYPQKVSEFETLINKRIGLIHELLVPFNGHLVYDKNSSDLFIKKKLERSCNIEICNLI